MPKVAVNLERTADTVYLDEIVRRVLAQEGLGQTERSVLIEQAGEACRNPYLGPSSDLAVCEAELEGNAWHPPGSG